MELFKNIKSGATIYCLDKTELNISTRLVKTVSSPYVQTIPTVNASLVIDVTLSDGTEDKVYTMPDTASIAYAGDLVLATEREALIAECTKMKEEAEEILAKVDKYKAIVDKYDSLVIALLPDEAERKDINDRLTRLEESLEEILILLKK